MRPTRPCARRVKAGWRASTATRCGESAALGRPMEASGDRIVALQNLLSVRRRCRTGSTKWSQVLPTPKPASSAGRNSKKRQGGGALRNPGASARSPSSPHPLSAAPAQFAADDPGAAVRARAPAARAAAGPTELQLQRELAAAAPLHAAAPPRLEHRRAAARGVRRRRVAASGGGVRQAAGASWRVCGVGESAARRP